MANILIIDDDLPIGNMLEEALRQEGYAVWRAYSGTEALLLLEKQRPDLALLDLMLPGMPGEQLLPRLAGIPVIVVSAKADLADKVGLLRGGAVDYVTKPFVLAELLARVAAGLRRGADPQDAVLVWHDLRLDSTAHQVWAAGQPVHLTRTEFALLRLLAQNPGQVLARSQLLERMAADTPDCTESSLKMHVSNLRKKLRAAGSAADIQAVWGIGFRLV